jgi:hypothetical protein
MNTSPRFGIYFVAVRVGSHRSSPILEGFICSSTFLIAPDILANYGTRETYRMPQLKSQRNMSGEIRTGSSAEDLDGQTVKGSVDPNTNVDELRSNINAKLANPLGGFTAKELAAKGETYCRDNGISDEEDIRAFRLGATIAQDFELYGECKDLTPDEKDALQFEIEHKWRQPWKLYLIVILCSTCAAVQGMGKLPANQRYTSY